MGFEENEISIKSQGGTELTKRGIAARIPEELSKEFQVIPSRVRDLHDDKIRIYWMHDLALDPELAHLKEQASRERFHKFVFSSHWQLNQFVDTLGFPHDENSVVIETPVVPFKAEEIVKSKDEIRLIYFSTPHRGLEILVPVFEKLCEKYDNIYLDVFSSFEIYGWKGADKPYEALFERCKNHPKIVYHGFKPAEELRAALGKAHIFAYPSIWMETACRCLIESMSAGLFCVHPNYGALPDTSGGLTYMYPWTPDVNLHANQFYASLEHAINSVHNDDVQNYLKLQKIYADTRFNIDKLALTWESLMRQMLDKYPTAELRAAQRNQMFTYKI